MMVRGESMRALTEYTGDLQSLRLTRAQPSQTWRERQYERRKSRMR